MVTMGLVTGRLGINPSLDGRASPTFGDMPRSWLRGESKRMADNRFSLLGRDMAIDLGTANTLVYVLSLIHI